MTSARAIAPLGAGLLLAATLPWWSTDLYQLHLGTLIGIYWILIAGLNLVVGYSGQLSIGHVGLLALGSYTYAILCTRWGAPPYAGLAAAGAAGGLCGLLLGLPSLRLPGFYFAMATIAFALIVSEITLAQSGLTGGGQGIAVPALPAPFDSPGGLYAAVLALAASVTWLSWNVARLGWGRALIAVRDSAIAAQAVGVPVLRAKLYVFVLSGITAGISGALFGVLQSYVTPDTFAFDLGLFFFVCIIIGGRGSIVGPLFGTVVLTALPELSAPLAKFSNLLYGALLLVVVLLVPEGIGHVVGRLRERRGTRVEDPITPDVARLERALRSLPK
jgi:branched-chain amino acid transport system permease protein